MKANWRVLPAALALLVLPATAVAQPGTLLPDAGAVQGGMAGVSTATPLDVIGALHWNPAAIGRLGRDDVSIGGGFIYPDISVSSSFPRPLERRVHSGRTRSDTGVGLASGLGVVFKTDDDSLLTYGMGIITIRGGG